MNDSYLYLFSQREQLKADILTNIKDILLFLPEKKVDFWDHECSFHFLTRDDTILDIIGVKTVSDLVIVSFHDEEEGDVLNDGDALRYTNHVDLDDWLAILQRVETIRNKHESLNSRNCG